LKPLIIALKRKGHLSLYLELFFLDGSLMILKSPPITTCKVSFERDNSHKSINYCCAAPYLETNTHWNVVSIANLELYKELPSSISLMSKVCRLMPRIIPSDRPWAGFIMPQNTFPAQRFLRKVSEHSLLLVSIKTIKSRLFWIVKYDRNLNFLLSPKLLQFQKYRSFGNSSSFDRSNLCLKKLEQHMREGPIRETHLGLL
jgi:hypothetical protein